MEGGFSQAYKIGVENYYSKEGHNYNNPHKYDIERLIRKKLAKGNPFLQTTHRILDLACGNGEATMPLLSLGYKHISGSDPYTYLKYIENTGLKCEKHSFVEILNGAFDEERYDAIICSYALHLVKQGMMHDFCNKLAHLANLLIIISPHKFPAMKEIYGWKELEHFVGDRIHLRIYKSLHFITINQEENSLQQKIGE